MKLSYQGNNYCLSSCAKDRFQNFILTPLVFITVTLLIVTVTLITFLLVGLAAQGLFEWFFIIDPLELGFLLSLSIPITVFLLFLGNMAIDDWVNYDYTYERRQSERNPTPNYFSITIWSAVILLAISLIGIVCSELLGIIHINPLLAGMAYTALLVFFGILFALAAGLLKLIWVLLLKANKLIDRWVNTKYETKYKKTCTLLERCD